MTVLSVDSLTFGYSADHMIFNEASVRIHQNDRLGLWAMNGTGKTTFLKIITGLLKPDSGRIVFNGKERQSEKSFHDLRLNLGFVLQHSEDQLFFPEVIEDVAFGPLNQGFSRQEALKKAEEILEQLHLQHLKHAISSELSGGQKKMVALASVLAMDPKMLLLDEPTAGLDVQTRLCVINLLKELSVPWILVSHDPALLSETCNRFITIDQYQFHEMTAPQVHQHEHAHFFGTLEHHHD